MSFVSFHDFDEYVGAIGQADVNIMMQKQNRSLWSIQELELDGIGFQQAFEGSGITAEGAVHSDGLVFFTPLTNARVHSANGTQLQEGDLVMIEPGAEFCLSSAEETRWCSIFIPIELLPAFAEDSSEAQLRVIPKSVGNGMDLYRLIQRFSRAVADDSGLLTESSGAVTANQDFLNRINKLLPIQAPEFLGRPRHSRPELLRRISSCLDNLKSEQTSVPILAKEIGVSERTLRSVFRECFGISPTRYLQLRQLHLVRRVLKQVDPSQRTVRSVLTEFGIWEFSRFARRYRQLFGELPSETIQRTS